MGKIENPEYYKRKYRVDEAYYVEELPSVLKSKRIYVRKVSVRLATVLCRKQ